MISHFLRFRDLKARGIVANWPTLHSWIRDRGFPPGRLLAPRMRVWSEDELLAWLETRPVKSSAPLQGTVAARCRGRPRTAASATQPIAE